MISNKLNKAEIMNGFWDHASLCFCIIFRISTLSLYAYYSLIGSIWNVNHQKRSIKTKDAQPGRLYSQTSLMLWLATFTHAAGQLLQTYQNE
jgi:hypothetical protein